MPMGLRYIDPALYRPNEVEITLVDVSCMLE
jgi:hypothetical protein